MRCIYFFVSMALTTSALACDWPKRSLQENERLSDAVFVATVVGRESTRSIELEVTERFKGSVARRVKIPTIGDCDFFVDPSIQKGERFLVFLTHTGTGVHAGLGGGTARFVEGADIEHLRSKYRK
jgi:hypothetical protein